MRGQRGFTLVEALVALTVLVVVFLIFLATLDVSSNVAKTQGNVSDMTESLRFAMAGLIRTTRMAGAGGLPVTYPSDPSSTLAPLAVEVADSSDGSSTFSFGGRTALPGTDVLIVRGVISGALYEIGAGDTTYSHGSGSGTIVFRDTSPFSGRPQPLSLGSEHVGRPLLISLQTPLDVVPLSIGGTRRFNNYRVAIITSVSSTAGAMTVGFTNAGAVPSEQRAISLNPNGSFQDFSTDFVMTAGVLDDLTYLVAANDDGDPTLYRVVGATGTAQELVANVASLQVAIGCDANPYDGLLAPVEWFLSAANPNPPTGDQWAAAREVRVSVVAQTQDPDMKWQEQLLIPENSGGARTPSGYRARALTVAISLRSQPALRPS